MALGLGAGDRVARLERVRRSDGVPLAIERAALSPADPAGPRSGGGHRFTPCWRRGACARCARCSAFRRPIWGRAMRSCWAWRRASAGLRIERISYLPSGRVVEFTRSLYRGDAYDFAVELKLAPEGRKDDDMTQSFMAREVAEIPAGGGAVPRPVADAVAAAAEAMRRDRSRADRDGGAGVVGPCRDLPEICGRAGGGGAGRLGRAVGRVDLRRPLRLAGAACIGISQSGRSPDIVEMMRAAGDGGALTVAITNFADAPMAEASAHCLPLRAGEERSVAATKTFVTCVLAGLGAAGRMAAGRCPAGRRGGAAGGFRQGADAGLVAAGGAAVARAVAVCAGARSGLCHRLRGGAEVQGDLRAARREPIRRPRCCTGRRPSCRRSFRSWRWGSRMRRCRMSCRRPNGWRRRGRMCS